MADPGSYLKVGVVIIRVFRLPHLHLHSRLLHELAGGQGHGPQHIFSAALERFLQDLAGHKAGNIMAGQGQGHPAAPSGRRESLRQPKGAGIILDPDTAPTPTPSARSHWKGPLLHIRRCSPFRAIPLQGGLKEPTEPIRDGPNPAKSRGWQEGGHTEKPYSSWDN